MSKSRLEMFADGVFAIAATLLIVRVSVDAPGGELGKALIHAWPQYAAYVLSFVMIGIWWVNHHAFCDVVEGVDRTFLFANISFLVCIAFIPFPTGLVAEHFHDAGLRAAVITYGITQLCAALTIVFVWFHAANGGRLLMKNAPQALVKRHSRDVAMGVPMNVGVIVVAIWFPYAALVVMALAAAFYVFGGSILERTPA